MQKSALVDYKLDDGGDRFTDVADMPEKRGKAETPSTAQREHVHEAIAWQKDANQEGRDEPIKTRVMGLHRFQMWKF